MTVSQFDEVDRGVLAILKEDGRATARSIALSLGVAQSTARVRLNRLLDSGIVTVVGIADPAATGRPLTYFSHFDVSGSADKAVELVESMPTVGWIALLDSGTRVAIQGAVRDVQEMVQMMDTLRSSPDVANLETEIILRTHPGGDSSVDRPEVDDFVIDDIDKILISELSQDGRRTYTAMAEATGLSVPSVRERVIRLIRSNVVRIDTIEDAQAFGRHRLAALGVRVDGPISKVVKAIVHVPSVTYAVEVAGTVDLRVEVACADDADLAAVATQIRQLPNVCGLDVSPYARLVQNTGSWLQQTPEAEIESASGT